MAATPSRRAPRSGEPADQIDAHCPQRAVVQVVAAVLAGGLDVRE